MQFAEAWFMGRHLDQIMIRRSIRGRLLSPVYYTTKEEALATLPEDAIEFPLLDMPQRMDHIFVRMAHALPQLNMPARLKEIAAGYKHNYLKENPCART